jgi:transposase
MNQQLNDIIAIDIAKDTLQVQTQKDSFNITNNTKGFSSLLKYISNLELPFVICEATGGYERDLMAALHKNNISVSLVNPARVRAFANSEGIKAKTDPIDAKVLFNFAQQKKLRATPARIPQEQELKALMDRRSHLKEQLAREKNRLQKCPPSITTSIKRMIRIIEKELSLIDEQIRKLTNSDEKIRAQSKLFQSVIGVGEVTTWSILAYLNEIGHVGRNQLIALAGVPLRSE